MPPDPRRENPATTGVGIVGLGYWGSHLARNVVAARGARLAAIAEAEKYPAERAQAEYPQARLHRDLDSLLADEDVGAVIVATPAATHVEFAMKVLQSGRHVLVEKPLALDVAGGRALVDEARTRGLVAMVGHTFLYSPAVQRLAQLVKDGALGQTRYADSRRLLGQARRDCDVLWDLGAHDVSVLMTVLGETPHEVTGDAYRHMSLRQYDTCFAHLFFPSGVDASLHVSWVNPFKVRLLTLVGTRQMAIYDDVPLDQKVTVFGAGLDDAEPRPPIADDDSPFANMDLKTTAGDRFIPGLSSEEPLLREVEDFVAACAGGRAPLATAQFGLDVVLVLEAISGSIARGGVRVRVAASD